MKAVFNILMVVVVLMSALTAPALILAQDYTLLEPSVLPAGQGSNGTVDFKTYIESGFKTFLAVVVIIAIVMLTASGLQYITAGSGGGKGEAKTRALAAMIGLLIALSSYLILRTINPALVDLTLDINDRGGDVGRDISAPTNPPPGTGGGGSGGVILDDEGNPIQGDPIDGYPVTYTGPEGVYGPIPDNEFEVRQRITDATNGKVTFNDVDPSRNRDCREGNESDCRTYVGGLNDDQINGIINISNMCDCNIVVSGAAEPGGHSDNSSHYSGNAFDIAKGPIDGFIRSSENVDNQGNGVRYVMFGGQGYCEDEDDIHWHCRF